MGQLTDTTHTNVDWTYNPSTAGTLASWTYDYAVYETDETTVAPAWIYFDAGAGEIVIDAASATTEGVYNFKLRGEAVDDASNPTGKYGFDAFSVVIYSITAVAPTDYVYGITSGSQTYTFPAFTCTNCADTSYTITYSLVDGSGVDQTGVYSWLSIDSSTRTVTINSSLDTDAGDYPMFIRGTLDDAHSTNDEIAWQVTLLTILPET